MAANNPTPTASPISNGPTLSKNLAFWANIETYATFLGVVVQMMHGPEVYLFTARTVTAIAQRVLAGEAESGFQTAALFGESLLQSMGAYARHQTSQPTNTQKKEIHNMAHKILAIVTYLPKNLG